MTQVQLKYSIAPPTKAPEISAFLLKNFFPYEPISSALNLPINQVSRWFPSQVSDCLQQEVSIHAVDAKTGEIVGVAINIIVEKKLQTEDGKSEGRGLLDILDPKTESVMVDIAKFLGILNETPDSAYRKHVPSSITTFNSFNCIYLAVLPTYGGLGIGKRLVDESLAVAKQKGIAICQVDTTSEFSYRIFQKHCGYEVIREIDLSPYIPGIEKIDSGAHKKGRILLKKI
ncbi:Dopamine N-acetyltransferase [Orchesella cincta]|uniref:Dopamine N-acetyltransferase n=1 Tax=Orchesella cincta TaxID=48709 RepID=A0A1D2MLA7_ORCCI|nr:Dopamine N-acetyltransferase [Orchesella cincta]